MTFDDLVDIELSRHDWSRIETACGLAADVPANFRRLMHASSEAEHNRVYWTLENTIVVQGNAYDAAACLVPAMIAAISQPSRRVADNVSELLFQVIWGNAHPPEWDDPNSRFWQSEMWKLYERINLAASKGLWTFYRYAADDVTSPFDWRELYVMMIERVDGRRRNFATSVSELAHWELDVIGSYSTPTRASIMARDVSQWMRLALDDNSPDGADDFKSGFEKVNVHTLVESFLAPYLVRAVLAALQDHRRKVEVREALLYVMDQLARADPMRSDQTLSCRKEAAKGLWTLYGEVVLYNSRTALELAGYLEDEKDRFKAIRQRSEAKTL